MEIKINNPFQDKNFGIISSFVCEGGMVGKGELKIAKSVYPPNWGGPKDIKATEVIELKNEKK